MQSVDQDVYLKASRELTEDTDSRILKYISSLGAVHEATYDKHSEGPPVACPYCGQQPATMHHYLWHCQHPTLERARNSNNTQQQDFILQNLKILPTYMKYGIPHTMTSQFDQPWWPFGDDGDESIIAQMAQKDKMEIGVTARTLPTQIQDWVKGYAHLDAYQAFASMTNQDQPVTYDIPDVDFIDAEPSEVPNVFSDGALKLPTCPAFALSNSA
eukprot:5645412-Karenia_brevis.AAC.1